MKANPQIKLYKYDNSAFILIAVIDDYQQISFEHSLYSAGTFTVTINYNIPNARLFSRGLFVQFGNNPHDFGEILTMRNSIGPDGKGSEILNITGYDARYLFKRRIIRNLNANDVWAMTAKGEICLRSLVRSECGDGAETKRRLPISNVIPEPANAKGGVYSVSESYTNLYDALCTIATQSEIGWAVTFENGALTLEVFEGRDLKDSVFFSTDFESLANGEYTDTAESFANVLYIGGKGEGSEQDMYEGAVTDERGNEPTALDRFEAYDSQTSMTTEEEYEAEADAMLSQYSQNVTVSGAGLVKCPFVFRENYDVGDVITLRFSDKTAVTQILSVTEQWSKGSYTLSFSFGKPQNNLAQQISLLLKKISNASKKTKAIECVKWYTIPTDTAQSEADVTFDTLGFTGAMTANATFTLYADDEGTGSKIYNVYVKNLSGNHTLTLTTGKAGATSYALQPGTYNAQIYVDENGSIIQRSISTINSVTANSSQAVTSGAVASAVSGIEQEIDALQPVDVVADGNMKAVTSNAVFEKLNKLKTFHFHKQDNYGSPEIILFYDVTAWYTGSQWQSEQICATAYSFRTEGYNTSNLIEVLGSVGYTYPLGGDYSFELKYRSISDRCDIIPCIIRDIANNKYYLALAASGSDTEFFLFGIFSFNQPVDNRRLLCSNSSIESLPSGWEIIFRGENVP